MSANPGIFNEKIDTYLQKYANMVEALTELTGNVVCYNCSKKLRNIFEKYGIHKDNNHLGGGRSSLPMNETDGLDNDYSTYEYK